MNKSTLAPTPCRNDNSNKNLNNAVNDSDGGHDAIDSKDDETTFVNQNFANNFSNNFNVDSSLFVSTTGSITNRSVIDSAANKYHAGSDRTWQAIVKSPMDGTIVLNVGPNDCVRDVKTRCQGMIKIPVKDQRLVCGGKEFVDGDMTLSSAGLCDGSNLEIKFAVAGGAGGSRVLPPPNESENDDTAQCQGANPEASESGDAMPVSVAPTRHTCTDDRVDDFCTVAQS